MKANRFLSWAVLAGVVAAGPMRPEMQAAESPSGETYVLVHGAWGGGWAWRDVQQRLEAEGHTVYRPTLTGHGERVHLSSPEIDLSLHVRDVLNLLEWEQLEEVVLLGHSYGGMVVTGVAEQAPHRIKRLIYVDAIVPEDGESVNTAFSDGGTPIRASQDGFMHPAWVQEGQPIPHDVPHSARCFEEPLALRNPERESIESIYLYLVDPGKSLEEDAFHRFYLRALERDWKVVVKEDWDHNPQWSKPAELVELLHEQAWSAAAE